MTITKVPLDAIVTISGGGTPSKAKPEYFTGEIPWVSPKDMKFWDIVDSQDHITEEAIKNSTAKLIAPGAILVVIRSGVLKHSFPIGINKVPVAINQDLKALTCSDRVDATYLARFLQSNARNLLTNVRGTTADNIPTESIRQIQVPLPPLSEQKRIAEILDRAEALRAKRRAALALLDELTQSIFLDMFGDPVTNTRGYRRSPLVDACKSPEDIKCGPFGTQLNKSEFREEGVPLWGIKNVNRNFELPTHEFLEARTANRLQQYSIETGDIVMTRKGTVGNCAVYPDGLPIGVMHSDLLRLRVDRKVCSPIFLSHQLHFSRDVEHQLALISGGAVMPGINVTRLKSLEVLLPPVDEQNAFASRIERLDRLRLTLKTSLREFNTLFASLQHRAFRGEL